MAMKYLDRAAEEVAVNELARRLVWGQNLSQAAFEMGVPLKVARRTTRTPEYRELVKRLQAEKFAELDARDRMRMADVQATARRAAPDAINQLVTLMKTAASEGVQRLCANDIIEYAGVTKAPERAPTIQLQAGQMAVLVTALREDHERHRDG